MSKIVWLLILQGVWLVARSQKNGFKKTNKNQFADSTMVNQWKESGTDQLPVMGFEENEKSEHVVSMIPSMLTANKDVFMSMAAFHFSISRFSIRGYESNLFSARFNGISLSAPEEGVPQWNLLTGLNEVTKNMQTAIGLRPTAYAFGNMGSISEIDARASKQRVQTVFTHAFSNRNFTRRWSFTHSSGFTKKGWAYSISGSFRYAEQGYVPGTFYNGKSYFLSVDKKIDDHRVLSLTVLAAPLVTGKQGPVTKESVELTGTPYYNPYWGYQSGVKRNANIRSIHQPLIVMNYDHRINNHDALSISVGLVLGSRSDTGLDWYKSADPRADYYRYLPGYQQDPLLKAYVRDVIKNNPDLLQINWNKLIDINRNSHASILHANGVEGNRISGKRAHYIIEERMALARRLEISGVYHSLVSNKYAFTTGGSFQVQRTHRYKKIQDLLGGDFYVDWNQFAERDFPDNPTLMQNDLNRPNRILHTGDRFGYDYLLYSMQAKAWAQLAGTGKKLDFFSAAELSYQNFQREGLVKNGLFPENSEGKSALNEFTGVALKAGITYKYNGRKYIYLHTGYFVKPPLLQDVYISPKTRDNRQEQIQNEKIITAELGYVWNAPTIRLRISSYLTASSDGMNITTFYHDGFGNFVNYALSGINKMNAGIESGMDISLSEQWSFTTAISLARYLYTSRQKLTVMADNDASVIERGEIYSKNFRVGGTPQEAYGAGIAYQLSGHFFANLTASYFRQQWLDFNPLRRTYHALDGLVKGTDQWKQVIEQKVLPEQYTVDLLVGTTVRIKMIGSGKKQTVQCIASINNLFNNQSLISGGYEQLRFDTVTKNPEKFPPKFFYAMGLNFSVTLNLRL